MNRFIQYGVGGEKKLHTRVVAKYLVQMCPISYEFATISGPKNRRTCRE